MTTAKTVLIVEDEPGLRQAYEIVLKAQGYQVITACDGQEGLTALKKHAPDLVLLDMLMPKLDGLGFMRAANIALNYPNTKVIAFSNLSDSDRLEAVKKIGIYEHVLKASINPGQLVTLVARALKDPA